jgi:4-hydroxy-3-methylbut-2-enyl diphosphate reductase
MKILTQNIVGFCGGVQRSLDLLNVALFTYSEVYMLGEIVNNKLVVEQFRQKGAIFVDNALEIPANSVVVIRAHGETKENIEHLKKKSCKIIDATCPKVQIIRDQVVEKEAEGYKVLILGNANHPEVLGFSSLIENKIFIEDSENFSFLHKSDKFFMVTQTSYNYHKYLIYAQKLTNTADKQSKLVVILDSICYTTKERQNSAVEIAKQSDTILVVGDKISSNTTKLFEIASQNCKNTYFITTVSDLKSVKYKKNIKTLGILSGASTPKELVAEVIKIMSEFQKTDEQKTENQEFIELMEKSLAKSDKDIRLGDTEEVAVVSADETGLRCNLVNTHKKVDMCFIDKDEVEIDGEYDANKYQPGEIFKAVFLKHENQQFYFSKKLYEKKRIENEKAEQILAGKDFKFTFNKTTKNNSCLIGKLGDYSILVPASQITFRHVKDINKYIGKELKLRVLPPENSEDKNIRKKTIFASQKLIMEEERAARDEAFWSKIEINNVLEGKVKRFGYKDGKPFGAFISIDGHDCLAHIGDLSWTKVEKPEEILELGKVYEFVVLSFDKEKNRVSLGYKQLQKRPYELLATKYPVGTIVKGIVKEIPEKGFFAVIDLGEDEGIVYISEIADKFIESINSELSVGQEVEAKVIGVERFNKVKLSIKQATPIAEPKEKAKSTKDNSKTKKTQKADSNEYIGGESMGATLADFLDAETTKKLKETAKNNKK